MAKPPSGKWTTKDVESIIDTGRRVARLILGAFATDLDATLAKRADLFRAADEQARRQPIDAVRTALLAEGVSASMAEAHIEGAIMMIDAKHPIEGAADRARRH